MFGKRRVTDLSAHLILLVMPISCVVAVGKNHGIATDQGCMPWHLPQDLRHFKCLTNTHVLVMGRKTYDSLPQRPLSDRLHLVITNDTTLQSTENVLYMSGELCCKYVDECNKTSHVFIIGGQPIYEMFKTRIQTIYVTHIHDHPPIPFTKYFFDIPKEFHIVHASDEMHENDMKYRFLRYEKVEVNLPTCDEAYLAVCKHILDHGETREDRTGTGTLSVFGQQMKFDLRTSIPLLTTKRVAWKSCIQELLWFLRGDTNAKHLQQVGVSIWNGNSSKEFLNEVGLSHLQEGDCGANYSFQWRHFGGEYKNMDTHYSSNDGVDQIAYIEHLLKHDKHSRRIFLSAWNPCDLKKTVLPPCHVSAQFYVHNNNMLSCHMYQRSCDMFLGVPFNIFSYAVLTQLLAVRNGFTPGFLTISTGDTHIYKNHVEQMETQLKRLPRATPMLKIQPSVNDKPFNEITLDDFELIGYFPQPALKGVMSV